MSNSNSIWHALQSQGKQLGRMAESSTVLELQYALAHCHTRFFSAAMLFDMVRYSLVKSALLRRHNHNAGFVAFLPLHHHYLVQWVFPSQLSEFISLYFFFFFNDTATTEIYTLSLHDALPI